jgi:hypothetical protein
MKYLALLLFGLVSNVLLAQTQFLKGYFIDNNDIRTECLIKYSNTRNTPTNFEYKLTENDNSEKKELGEVKLFVIEDVAKFIRATVEMDRYSENLDYLSTGGEIILKPETHFLKVIQEGVYTLYIYEENGLEKFFYSNDKSPSIKQLLYKKYYTEGNTSMIMETQTFKRQLWSAVKCDKIQQSDIERLHYLRDDLENYFEKVNECVSGAKVVKKYKREKSYCNLKISGITNFVDLSGKFGYYNNTYNYSSNFDTGNKTVFGGGVEFECVLPFYNYRVSIVSEPNIFVSNSTTVSPVFDNFLGVYRNENVKTNLKVFNIPIGIKYCVYKSDSYNFSVNYNRVIAGSHSLDVKIGERGATSEDVAYGVNSFGLGFSYKKIELEYKIYISPKDSGGDYLMKRNSLILRYTVLSGKKTKINKN